jgi:hypothetical protein
MFNKLKNIFKKNKPVWNESTGEVNITQLPTYDIVSSPGWVVDMWLPTRPSNRINKIKRILKKI